jgi:hypothetical protein
MEPKSSMPNPKSLKPGDLVRFTAMPDEWSRKRKGSKLFPDDISFMKAMIKRTWPSRVEEIDDYGFPWISAQIRVRGKLELHTWAITESSGWRLIRPRRKK